MIGILRFVTWPHLRRHRLRTSLTFLGIALGVAVIVAIAMVNRTLIASFHRTIDLVTGASVLQVRNAESGFKESLFPIIRDTVGVKDAAPAVQGFLPVVGVKGERLYIYGVDLLTDSFIREYHFANSTFGFDVALDFIARPDSVALTQSMARRLNLPLGSKITLSTGRGSKDYTVRALLQEEGAAKVFGGSFALMDLPVAQIAFGKEGKLDIVDLTVEEGEEIEAVRERVRSRLMGAARVERPRERGRQIESLLTSFRLGLFFVSLIALFVGFFLIYNTVSISVIQRRREIGTLRCLGLRRGGLLLLFLTEALLLALPGSLVGVLLGALLAEGAVLLVGRTVSNLFLQVDLAATALSLRDLWTAFASGIGVSVLAGLLPAAEASRISPLESSRMSAWSPRTQRPSRASAAGLIMLFISLFLWLYSPPALGGVEKFTLGITATMIFLLALCFLSPFIILLFVRFLRSWLRGFGWVGGRLSLDNLSRSPIRSGITVATLMISLASIFTIATFIHSVRGSLLSWVDQMVTADLLVTSGAKTAGSLNVALREDLAREMKTIPGVKVVDYYRVIRSTYQGRPIDIESFSAHDSAHVRDLPMVQGDGKETLRRLGWGEGVIVSESFQLRFGKGGGDTVELITPAGLVLFKIIGVYVDYSSDAGSVMMDRALYKRFWLDELVDTIDLWLSPRADKDGVIERIRRDYGERYQLFVSTHGELRETVVGIMEQTFNVNYAVLIVAAIVAILSVINTLIASVIDRNREIGVLRSIGATREQLKKMVVAEAGWMGLAGGVLGLIAGTIMSYHHVVYNTKVLTGWTFQYHYPFGVALLSLIMAVVLCLLASFFPAREAGSTNIVTAVGYE